MDPQLLVFVFMLAGVLLIFAEFFVPSGGIIAILCACCFGASLWYAWQSWYSATPLYFYLYLGSLVMLIPGTVIGAIQIINHTSLGNRVVTLPPALEDVTPYLEEEARLARLIGSRGTALNLMTPGGLVSVDGERLHAISEGLMIAPQTEIEVVAVKGTRIVVRAVEASSELAPDADLADDTPKTDPWA